MCVCKIERTLDLEVSVLGSATPPASCSLPEPGPWPLPGPEDSEVVCNGPYLRET